MELLDLTEKYQTPPAAVELLQEHPPLIICGVTGAGKDTIARYLMQNGSYAQIVSHTTRAARPHRDGHEVNGVDYWFIDNDAAIEMLKAGEFIEAELVHGNETLYGTSIAAYKKVLENGKQPLLEIDIKGVLRLQSEVPGLTAVFLVPPDFATWQKRLRGRGTMDDEELRRRLQSAKAEFKTFLDNEDFIPITNTEVVNTADRIQDGSYRNTVSIEIARKAVKELLAETESLLAA